MLVSPYKYLFIENSRFQTPPGYLTPSTPDAVFYNDVPPALIVCITSDVIRHMSYDNSVGLDVVVLSLK
jgi:hypothetical protein